MIFPCNICASACAKNEWIHWNGRIVSDALELYISRDNTSILYTHLAQLHWVGALHLEFFAYLVLEMSVKSFNIK